MHPAHILNVKYLVLNSELSKLQPIAKKIVQTQDVDKIEPLIAKLNH
jgi:phosphotransferase system enzyme I (PtsI)